MEASTIRLKALRPEGEITEADFDFATAKISTDLAEGDILVRLQCISADPFQRGRMKMADSGYTDIMSGFVSGEVIESKNAEWPVGALFGGYRPYKTVQIITAKETAGIWNLTPYISREQASLGTGALGMPGATAYHGLFNILRPKKEEVLFVSAASGAVGALVGQMAKSAGCTVIGSAGGPEKGKHLMETLKFDHAIDYRSVSNTSELEAKIREVSPDGIDMDFENVGGMHFEACFRTLKPFGRIAVCGVISRYNEAPSSTSSDTLLGVGESNLERINIGNMIYSRQRIEGFLASEELAPTERKFLPHMAKLIANKEIVCEETIFEGPLQDWPKVFVATMNGKHLGKTVLRLE